MPDASQPSIPPSLKDLAAIAEMRRTDPVFWHESHKCWVVTRYEDVDFCLDSDGTLLSSSFYDWHLRSLPRVMRPRFADLMELPAHVLTVQDGPYHDLLKAEITSVFNRAVKKAAPDIEAVVARVISDLPERFDFVSAVASPLAHRAICRTIGVSTQAEARIIAAATDVLMFLGFDPEAQPSTLMDRATRAKASLFELMVYLEERIVDSHERPRGDFIGEMVTAPPRDGCPGLSAGEMAYQALTLLIAGFITTTNFLSLSVRRLLEDNVDLRALATDQGLLRRTCESLLRLDGPTVFVMRRALRDFELHGKTVRKDDPVLLHLLSANHDEERFGPTGPVGACPASAGHIAFGKRLHYCTGVPLAKFLGLKVFEEIGARCPDLRLQDGDAPQPFTGIAAVFGLSRLPLQRG